MKETEYEGQPHGPEPGCGPSASPSERRHPCHGIRPPPLNRAGWSYLLLAGATFALLVFQSWFGGELVYGLGAGVSAAGQGVVSPEQGQMGLAPFAHFTEATHSHHGH